MTTGRSQYIGQNSEKNSFYGNYSQKYGMNFKTYLMNLNFLSFQCFFSVLVSGVVELVMQVV